MTESSETSRSPATSRPYRTSADQYSAGPAPANLADILERVLDKGIIIAGDIKVNLLDIELLTIKIRLLIVSVDKAAEMVDVGDTLTITVEPPDETDVIPGGDAYLLGNVTVVDVVGGEEVSVLLYLVPIV